MTREADVVVVKVRIENKTNPSWGGGDDDSDDILCVGNVIKNEDDEWVPDTAAAICYTILPTGLNIETKQITIMSGTTGIRTLAGTAVAEGENKAVAWDGKNAAGEYTEHEQYDVGLLVELEEVASPFVSNHTIVDLGVRYKPKVHIHSTEFCPPVRADYHLQHSWLLDTEGLNHYEGYDFPLDTLLSQYDAPRYYADLIDPSDDHYVPGVDHDFRRNWDDLDDTARTGHVIDLGAEPAIYVRGFIHEEGGGGQFAFMQYWMYESASTWPVGEYGGTEETACEEAIVHEGDWEFFQVVVKLDTVSATCQPYGATYSMHYYGVSLPWEGEGVKQVLNTDDTPWIFVASGAHATYPSARNWPVSTVPGQQSYYEGMWDDWGLPGQLYDSCEGVSGPEYSLVTLETLALWKGHWGDAGLTDASSGPASPQYRGGGLTIPYEYPTDYFNNMLPPEISAELRIY